MNNERSWHIDPGPTAAQDRSDLRAQCGLPSADHSLAEFERQVLPHIHAAYNLARLLCKDADAAQDVVQDALLRAYRSFAGFRGENARVWTLTIVRNCYYSWLASRRRKSRLEADSQDAGCTEELILSVPSDECTPEAILMREAERQTVRFVISTMPLHLRKVLMLREMEELSYRQISTRMALPIGTVMSRLARARREFADAWQHELNKRF